MITVKHPNGFTGILYGESSLTIYDEDGNEFLHTKFRKPNTEEEVYECLEGMPALRDFFSEREEE